MERKHLGSYYTPLPIARALTNWAIRSSSDRLLEPSFGEGAFISAAVDLLDATAASDQQAQILGTDIDPAAIAKVRLLLETKMAGVELRQGDFLAIEPSGSWRNVDAVIGNPPYVRHHRIEKGTIADFRRRQLGLTRASDLWCTFVIHSLGFLKKGGRLAFILPAAFLFTRYAKSIRDRLAASFETTTAVRLAFSTFADVGADERGVVILCSGYCEGKSPGWVEHVAWNEDDLEQKLDYLRFNNTLRNQPSFPFCDTAIPSTRLGEVADIRIGFVTGANRTFIVDAATISSFGLPQDTLFPVVSRTTHTPGIFFTEDDHLTAAAANQRVWLFAPSTLGQRHGAIRSYLATVSRDVRRNTLWFRKRPTWYQPDIGVRPDAVLTYMNHMGPRIVLLQGAEGGSNTFHAVNFHRTEHRPDPRLVALAMLTSSAQLSAERVGRAYGGGVLKLEPSEARQVELPIIQQPMRKLEEIAKTADSLLKTGNVKGASELADEALLKPLLAGHYAETRRHLLSALNEARALRLQRSGRRPRQKDEQKNNDE